ncbi:MAG: cation transporter [Segetibacter sp.]|nr:cation transporter [Segetibacter sp.]
MEKAKHNLQVQKWVTILAVVLFIAKIVAWHVTNSVAILSDALESVVNVVAGIIGFFSLYVAAKPSDEEHPYGHGKAEFVSAGIEGALIVAAGILILYETVQSTLRQTSIFKLDLGLWLIAITAVINFIAGYICLKVGKRNNSLALLASGKHLQTDTYSTMAVIAGLIIMMATKIYWIDKVIAAAMSFFIMYTGYLIVRKSVEGIMDKQDMELLQKMVTVLNSNRRVNWIDLHNLRIIKYGSQLHIDCHLTVPWYLNVHEGHEEIDALTNFLMEEFGGSIEFFVHTDGCLPYSCPLCNKFTCPVREQPFKHKVEWTLENLLTNRHHRITVSSTKQ